MEPFSPMALKYLADLYGSGGTEMMPALLEALGGVHAPRRIVIGTMDIRQLEQLAQLETVLQVTPIAG